MRKIDEIKAEMDKHHPTNINHQYYKCEYFETIADCIPTDRLEEICQAERENRCVVIAKEEHQPMFVKSDAIDIFDIWNDVTGAIPKGISWYYEAQAVIEEIAAMAFGAGIFYEAERQAEAEKALKGEQYGTQNK